MWALYQGDCREVMAGLEDNSVDAVVTDPPAGIAFMGRDWDTDKGGRREWVAWLSGVMSECLRVLKPGGHAFVWALPRTSHWTATALEDAGFEIRDCCVHIFSMGFPKSLDVSKAIDKVAGAERPVVAYVAGMGKQNPEWNGTAAGRKKDSFKPVYAATAPATDAAKQWQGFGTALKPASEHWWLCRKPLIGTVAQNVLEHGTGALNIDGCRVAHANAADLEKHAAGVAAIKARGGSMANSWKNSSDLSGANDVSTAGRWPPNTIFSHLPECGDTCAEGCAVAELDGQSGTLTSGKPGVRRKPHETGSMSGRLGLTGNQEVGYGDTGGASRFFPAFRYQAKAAPKERKVEGIDARHPTQKPVELMRWLVRLVTPPGGLILDPFTGSGTTGVAALREGFSFVGIEQSEEYCKIAAARIEAAEKAGDKP